MSENQKAIENLVAIAGMGWLRAAAFVKSCQPEELAMIAQGDVFQALAQREDRLAKEAAEKRTRTPLEALQQATHEINTAHAQHALNDDQRSAALQALHDAYEAVIATNSPPAGTPAVPPSEAVSEAAAGPSQSDGP